MNTLELSGLEYQVNHLLHVLDRLKIENNTLRQQLASQTRERSQLLEKNQYISERIRKIIAQLKGEMQ